MKLARGWTRAGYFVSGVILLVLMAASTAFGYGWSPVTAPTTKELHGVHFLTASQGWVVGAESTVYRTADGGSTWEPVTVDAANTLKGVAFADAQHGWITGDGGTILHTANGGLSWLRQTAPQVSSLSKPNVVDVETAWIGAPGTSGHLFRTTDGAVWTDCATGGSNSIRAVSFVNRTIGWAVGASGALYRSTNGGTAWTPQTPSGFTNWLSAVDGRTALDVLAVSQSGDVLRTEDGGDNWTVASGVAGSLYDVEWVDSDEAWIAGWQIIKHTNDRGASWDTILSPSSAGVNDLSFPDAATGYAVGSGGKVWKYTAPAPPIVRDYALIDVESVTATWLASPDAVRYEVSAAWTTGTVVASAFTFSNLPLGVSTYRVRAITSEGLPSPWASGTIANSAPKAPVVTVSAPVVNSDAVVVSWNAIDGATQGFECRVNGSIVATTSATQMTLGISPGLNLIEVRARSEHTYSPWGSASVTRVVQQLQTLAVTSPLVTAVYPAKTVLLSGTTGDHATTVTVESKIMGAPDWGSTGVTVRSSGTGVIPATAIPLQARTYYRLVSGADVYYSAGESNSLYVRYKPYVKVPTVPTVRRGRYFTTYTYAYTPRSNPTATVKFRLYRWSSATKKWRWYKTVTASKGAYSDTRHRTLYKARFKISRSGTWKVKAFYDGKTLYNDTTRYKNFKVR